MIAEQVLNQLVRQFKRRAGDLRADAAELADAERAASLRGKAVGYTEAAAALKSIARRGGVEA